MGGSSLNEIAIPGLRRCTDDHNNNFNNSAIIEIIEALPDNLNRKALCLRLFFFYEMRIFGYY